MTAAITGREQISTYLDENRSGDHICYYSDLSKMRSHYPTWDISIDLNETIGQIVKSLQERGR